MHPVTALRPRSAPAPAAVPSTVMVTGAGGGLGRQLVHHLHRRGMRVVRTDITPCAPPGADFVLGPYAGCPSYIPFLEVTLRRRKVDLLIPTVPDELPVLALAAPVLSARVAVAGAEPVALCHDRLLLMRHLARHGIPVPTTVTVRPSGVPRELMGPGPFVVRPRLDNAEGELRLIREGDLLPARNDTFIAQELMPGEEHPVQIHRSARSGEMTAVLLRRGPQGVLERPDPAPAAEIIEVARAAVLALDLTGAVSISVRRDAEGRARVVDVDLRIGAALDLVPEQLDAVLADAGLPLQVPRAGAEGAER